MAEKAHCHFCFDVITTRLYRTSRPHFSLSDIEEGYSRFEKRKSLTAHAQTQSPGNSDVNGFTNGSMNGSINEITSSSSRPERPLFVTWNLLKPNGKQLRGCIGTFEGLELEGGLTTYAETSAFHDTRFNPIGTKELSLLECGVSILTDFEPAADPFDWTLGVHGLRISFTYHSRRMGATYLPDVAVEQGWTQEETIVSLMRKAGWGGRPNEWRKLNPQVTRYKGTKESVSWGEYQEFIAFLENEGSAGHQERV